MPDFATIATLSPWIVALWLFLSFLQHQVLPLFVKHIWPQWSKQARADAEARRKAEEQDEQERRRREDRLFQALEGNTSMLSELRTTLVAMNSQMTRHADAISDLSTDVSAIAARIEMPRPSRKAKAEAGV